jgi:hypothetical protein
MATSSLTGAPRVSRGTRWASAPMAMSPMARARQGGSGGYLFKVPETRSGRDWHRLSVVCFCLLVRSGAGGPINLTHTDSDAHTSIYIPTPKPTRPHTHSAEELVQQSAKLVAFLDLAGHSRYLKTTLSGMVCVCVCVCVCTCVCVPVCVCMCVYGGRGKELRGELDVWTCVCLCILDVGGGILFVYTVAASLV